MGRTLLGIFAGLVIGVTVTAGAGMVRGATGSEGGSGWVPDIEQVYNKALSNVFESAGEKFTDPELKEFYDRLTGEITDSLSTPVPYDPGIEIPELDPGSADTTPTPVSATPTAS